MSWASSSGTSLALSPKQGSDHSLSCDLSLKNNGGSYKRILLNLTIFTKLTNGEAGSFKGNLRIVKKKKTNKKTLTKSQMTIVSAFISHLT